jgi:hypothetical protein
MCTKENIDLLNVDQSFAFFTFLLFALFRFARKTSDSKRRFSKAWDKWRFPIILNALKAPSSGKDIDFTVFCCLCNFKRESKMHVLSKPF